MTTKTREPVDMSAVAIARRLEHVRALYKLMVSLRQIPVHEARPLGDPALSAVTFTAILR